jgi:phosphatidylinositol-3-phosphatase
MIPAVRARTLAFCLCLCVLGGQAAQAAPPPIKHVFIIWLENENYDSTFGEQTKIPYLAKELPTRGAMLTQYYATGHLSLDNYITVVSGQPPNPQTQADCMFYNEFQPGTIDPEGVALGQGCVYPPTVKTVADQLEERGLTWKGYMDGMKTTCRHPNLNSQDDTQSAEVGDQYAARHNPFMYFHSIIDEPTCAENDVPLERLPADLQSKATTANYNFITPDLCNDGHDEPCVDGRPGGMETANVFLKEWVPKILESPAYKDDGLLVISFDEAEAIPGDGDASSCCGQPIGPNSPNNGGLISGSGGGRIGAVALSPYIRGGTVTATPYNHYAMLRTTEDIFGLPHLAYAGRDGLKPFGDDVFTGSGQVGPGAVGPPTIRVRGVPKHGCTRGFRARVRIKAKGLKRVRARVDKRVVYKKKRKTFRVRVRASRLKRGVHRFRVNVRHAGAPGHSVNHFRTCSGSGAARFAG